MFVKNSLGYIFLGSIGLFVLADAAFSQVGGGGQAIAKAVRIAEASAASREFRSGLNANLIAAAAARSKAPVRRPASPAAKTSVSGRKPNQALLSIAGQTERTQFVSTGQVDYPTRLADLMDLRGQEREVMIEIFRATKTEFERQVAAKGRQNNLSAALVFFLAATVTVYHNEPEPSEAAIDALWDGMEATLREMPQLDRLSDAEKEELYNVLVCTSGMILAFNEIARQNNDPDLLSLSRNVAGTMIRQTLNTNPEKIRFTRTGLFVSR